MTRGGKRPEMRQQPLRKRISPRKKQRPGSSAHSTISEDGMEMTDLVRIFPFPLNWRDEMHENYAITLAEERTGISVDNKALLQEKRLEMNLYLR